MLTRYAPLRSGPWCRKAVPAAAPDWKRREAEERRLAKEERDRERAALVYGCEYGQEFLRRWFRLCGCPLCNSGRAPRCELHHTKTRKTGGLAADQVPLCWTCHQRGGTEGWEKLEAAAGIDLRELARTLAGEGTALGYLPVERCPGCGIWHSARYFTATAGERLCQRCSLAGEA